MKKLHTFSPRQRAEAAMLKEILAKEGIDCLLKNDMLGAGLGEIPFTECYPELWLIDDEVYPRARLFVDNWLQAADERQEPWTCPACGESVEPQLGACWACDRERD